MKHLFIIALLAALTAIPARAGQFLEYTVRHSSYGDIGTYSNLVQSTSGGVDVTSRLDITVKLLGLVVHREQSLRYERWRDGRLVAFHNTTDRNGERYELSGEARGDGFLMRTPRGTYVAPADVRPSNPWSVDMLRSGPLLSTRDGTLLTARITGVMPETVTAGGRAEQLRRFDIQSDKREQVWINAQGVPVAFRTEEDGSPIDFILRRQETRADTQQAAATEVEVIR